MRTIRFFYDLGHPWPLWENGHDDYAMQPDAYGLSDDLAARLADLADEYEQRWDEIYRCLQDGEDWRTRPWAVAWIAANAEAVQQLRDEVADIAVVVDETHT